MDGEASVHIFDAELAKIVYRADGVWPNIPPLLPASKEYREYRQMSIGLGNL